MSTARIAYRGGVRASNKAEPVYLPPEGVEGVVLKSDVERDLVRAVESVLSGRTWALSSAPAGSEKA